MDVEQRTAGDRVIGWARGHVLLVDGLVALLWVAVALLFQPVVMLDSEDDVVWAVITVLMGVPLALRRSRPRLAVAGLGVLMVAHVLLLDLFTLTAAVATLSAAYIATDRLERRDRRWAVAAILAGTAWAALDYTREVVDLAWHERWPVVLAQWVLVGFFCLLGALARTRRVEIDRVAERTRLRERAQAQELQLAALDERTHIARELHDIVAHSLGVIIAQADGGRYAARADPAAAERALETIAGVGRGSLAEMRRLLSVLRAEEPRGVAPAPGAHDRPALLEEYRRAGLDVRLSETGSAPELTAAQALTVHRLLQEALANVLKHAGAVATRVEIDWEPGSVTLTVANPLPAGGAAQPDPGDRGHGLIGMRERVAMSGGRIEVGPVGSTWRVRASLPLDAVAAPVVRDGRDGLEETT